MKGHFHHYYEILYYFQGRANLQVEENFHEIKPGDLVLIDIRRMHSYSISSGENEWPQPEKIYVGFNMGFPDSVLGSDAERKATLDLFRPKSRLIDLDGEDRTRITDMLWRLAKEHGSPMQDSESACRLLLGLLLLEIRRLCFSPAGPGEERARVCEDSTVLCGG